jgi:superfamily II DNA/RNA helicase
MALLIGGVSFADQDRLLTQGVDVLIATPGRLLDHFERGKLLMNGVQTLVVDEADRMLDMGFIPDIERIFKLTPFTRQTLFFSATMPPEITRLTEQFLHNPERVEVSRPASTGANVTQRLVKTPANDAAVKRAALRAIIDSSDLRTAIVFCNRKTEVDVVAKSLQKHGYKAAPIHGDLPQPVRTATLAKFKAGEVNILVASDVAARGLDIPDVSHVLNYNVPRHADDYVHRIGRTARAGRKGDAITIVSPEDRKSIAAVEALIKQAIPFWEDLVVPEVAPRAPRGEDGEARSKSRERGGRSRRSNSRTRGGAGEPRPVEARATEEAVAAVSAAPAERTEHRPRRHEPRREPAHEGKSDGRNRGTSETAKPKPPRGPAREPRKELAFGDHTPAFLLRSTPK